MSEVPQNLMSLDEENEEDILSNFHSSPLHNSKTKNYKNDHNKWSPLDASLGEERYDINEDNVAIIFNVPPANVPENSVSKTIVYSEECSPITPGPSHSVQHQKLNYTPDIKNNYEKGDTFLMNISFHVPKDRKGHSSPINFNISQSVEPNVSTFHSSPNSQSSNKNKANDAATSVKTKPANSKTTGKDQKAKTTKGTTKRTRLISNPLGDTKKQGDKQIKQKSIPKRGNTKIVERKDQASQTTTKKLKKKTGACYSKKCNVCNSSSSDECMCDYCSSSCSCSSCCSSSD